MNKFGYIIGNIIGFVLITLIATLLMGLALKIVVFFLGVKLATVLFVAVVAFEGYKKVWRE